MLKKKIKKSQEFINQAVLTNSQLPIVYHILKLDDSA